MNHPIDLARARLLRLAPPRTRGRRGGAPINLERARVRLLVRRALDAGEPHHGVLSYVLTHSQPRPISMRAVVDLALVILRELAPKEDGGQP